MIRPSGGLNDAPHQLLPPCAPGNSRMFNPTLHGVNGTVSVSSLVSQRFLQNASCSGVTFVRFSFLNEFLESGGGLTGKGCVGDVHSPGTVVCGTGRSSIPKIGSPV